MISLREVHRYQNACLGAANSRLAATHHKIAEATVAAHALLEACFDEVLDIEGWDKTTPEMPADLREPQQDAVDRYVHRSDD